MAKRVRPTAWHVNPERVQACADQMVRRTLRESVKWCFGRQENLPQRAARPRLLEVAQNSLAGFTD